MLEQERQQKDRREQVIHHEAWQLENTWLPAPDDLAAYEAAAPGTTERLLALMSAQLSAAADKERALMRNQTLSIAAALIVAVVSIVAGYYVLSTGQMVEGLTLSGTGVAGLVLAFIRSTHPI